MQLFMLNPIYAKKLSEAKVSQDTILTLLHFLLSAFLSIYREARTLGVCRRVSLWVHRSISHIFATRDLPLMTVTCES